jgi:uncharacterized protein (TIGR02246 family)
MKTHLRSAALTVILTLASASGIAAESGDVEAIRVLQDEQAAAWNRHDAHAYAKLFAEDGEVINIQGWWWKGRQEIERKLSQAFAFVFAESRLSIVEVHAKVLDPDYALAHVIWQMEGARAPPGAPSPPREGIQLQVLRKGSEGWRIASFQNTNSIPEVPFPGPPPVGTRAPQ